jgi:hypothetical protein
MSTGAESARHIHNGPGCGPSNLAKWPQKKKKAPFSLLYPKKPNAEELKSELLRRDPSARCRTLSLQALADRLLELPPLELGTQAPSGASSNEITDVVSLLSEIVSDE